MAEPGPSVFASAAGSGGASDGTLPTRNRRTAFVLVAWVVVLVLASALVAWLRN